MIGVSISEEKDLDYAEIGKIISKLNTKLKE